MSEVYDLLNPYIDEEFWNFGELDLRPGTVYVIGRQHLLDHKELVRTAAESGLYTIIFCNAAEGAWTLQTQIQQYKIEDLVSREKILLIGGAKMDPHYPCLTHEHFLPKILDFEENVQAQTHIDNIFSLTDKPYNFLFLNGRARPHRKYLYEKFKRAGLLDRSLWTMLDSAPCAWRTFEFREHGTDVMSQPSPIHTLPGHYEVERYRQSTVVTSLEKNNVKHDLFNKEWGEIYIEPAPYVDTYFSLVTETICAESAYSFRTEKIAKPLAIGHPFIVASTPGFYRDLHRMGFQTFGHVIDESFDKIEHAQTRVNRIIEIVTDLCRQDLASFLKECYNVCKYNQQHLAEIRIQTRQEFPDRFFQFLQRYRQ
jgi:hypothetical protein